MVLLGEEPECSLLYALRVARSYVGLGLLTSRGGHGL